MDLFVYHHWFILHYRYVLFRQSFCPWTSSYLKVGCLLWFQLSIAGRMLSSWQQAFLESANSGAVITVNKAYAPTSAALAGNFSWGWRWDRRHPELVFPCLALRPERLKGRTTTAFRHGLVPKHGSSVRYYPYLKAKCSLALQLQFSVSLCILW